MASYKGPIIDVHCHFFPQRMFQAIWNFFESGGWKVQRGQVETMPDVLSYHGITRYSVLNYVRKPGQAASLNEWTAGFCADRPEALPFCTLHVDDDDPWSTVGPYLTEHDFTGIKIQPLVSEFPVDHPVMMDVCGRLFDLGKVLFIHGGTAPYTNKWLGLDRLERVLAKYPELRTVLAHMGAFEVEKALSMVDRFPNLYLDTAMIFVKTDVFNTVPEVDLEEIERRSDRIMFGSDFPNFPYQYSESINSIERLDISAAARKNIMHDNAVRFFGLD